MSRRTGNIILTSWAVLAFVAAIAAGLVLPAVASAMTDANVTLDQETGGQATRFTFTATTDADGSVQWLALSFPRTFDLSKTRAQVVTLEGLKRIRVDVQQQVQGSSIKLTLTPAVKPKSSLVVYVYDVVTANKGGTYPLGVTYSVAGQLRTVTGVSFRYASPSRVDVMTRWLDQQSFVTSFNSVKVLGMFLKPQWIVVAVPMLFIGWLTSIGLILVAFPLAIVGGLLLAFMKMAKIAPIRWIASVYINVIRGTPLFLQIFIAFIGLPIAGLPTPWFPTSVVVLALNSSAYLAEIFRAGIQSISKGQFEAASSLGMNYYQSMRFVIIPQTVKRVLPTMTSEFILLFKDTALLSAVGVFELMMYANNLVASAANLTPFVVAAVYYLIITVPLINLVARLEARLAVSEGGRAVEPGRKKRGELVPAPATAAEVE